MEHQLQQPPVRPNQKKNRACIAMVSLLALVVALKITQGDSQNHGFGPSSKPSTLHWALHKLEWLEWFLGNQLSLKDRAVDGWSTNPSLPGNKDFIRRYIAGGGGVARFSAHKHWGITSWFLITKVHHGYDLEAGRTCGLKIGGWPRVHTRKITCAWDLTS